MTRSTDEGYRGLDTLGREGAVVDLTAPVRAEDDERVFVAFLDGDSG